MIRRIAFVIALALAAPVPAHAQFSKLKERVKQRIDKKVEEKVDCALDTYVDRQECKDAKAAAQNNAKAGGRQDAQDNIKASGAAAAASSPGEGVWANYDFVPGDKILFAEDFSTDRVGNFPKRLELDNGSFEVVQWNNRRWLRSNSQGQFTITLPQALGERWTMEFELTVPWGGLLIGTDPDIWDKSAYVQLIDVSGTSIIVHPAAGTDGQPSKNISDIDPRDLIKDMFPDEQAISAPMHVRVQADGSYMKVYLEEHRIANMPNMGRWQGNKLRFSFRNNTINGKPWPPLISNISINSGGAELYDALSANGRLAVPGIYFDIGSDRIRPESSGTLREIADMLTNHADLKLTIEGHTDNVGDAAANQALSDKRAAAVKNTLVSQYGVSAARLNSEGFGSAKPVAPNDSPENRQKNRRVELVKN